MNHTPGPWKEIGSSVWSDIRETCICVSISTKANARLIAAAPDLLEALQDAIKTAEFEGHPMRAWHSKARAAISKATNA